MLLLIIIVLAALTVSALCSILEASLLSVSIVELIRRKDNGDKTAARMLDIKENHLEDGISAILTYNTIAHTVGAALSGAQAAVVFADTSLGPDTMVGIFSGFLTILILVFTEIIPKTVGTVHAGRLAGFSATVIFLMIKPPMKWILYVTRALTRLVSREKEQTTTRGDVQAMVKIAAQDGAIAKNESAVLSNLLRFEEINVADVMTPRTVLTMFEVNDSLGAVLESPEIKAFSRVPVYAEQRDNVEGYVLTRELLEAALASDDRDKPLSEFSRPVVVIEESSTVGAALKKLTQETHEHFAIVLDELGVLAGLVSLEDLFETALGIEIVDEFDQVADLRQKAMELREKRLARMRDIWKKSE